MMWPLIVLQWTREYWACAMHAHVCWHDCITHPVPKKPNESLYFGFRLWKGHTECVCCKCFALSVTSDNTYLIFNTFSNKACYSLCVCLWHVLVVSCGKAYYVLVAMCACVSSQLASMCFGVWLFICVYYTLLVCVCFPDYINTVSFSVSALQQDPNRQQEIRQAWSPITTTVTIQRPPCIPATRKWAN